jgi:hypothetical protein
MSIYKVKRYAWLVKGMEKCVEVWLQMAREPDRKGTFDGWVGCEDQGRNMQAHIDEIITLACEVDPEAVQKWKKIRSNISDLRIYNYQLARAIDGPDRPLPTPEEEAAAEAERLEAYRTGGLSLLKDAQGGKG